MKKVPALWASGLRIVASGFIFMFHYFGLTGHATYGLATRGLYIFFFLAGWFAAPGKQEPWGWFKGRLKRILVPYWPVIFVVLVANRFVGYKETTLLKDAMTFLGLSLFVENPVYVISWFITMIIILDISLLGARLMKPVWARAVFVFVFGMAFYSRFPNLINGFCLFYIGLLLNLAVKGRFAFSMDEWLAQRSRLYAGVNNGLFVVQNYTYSFFLVHGAVLIFVLRFLKISAAFPALALALVLSLVTAYVHNLLLKKYS